MNMSAVPNEHPTIRFLRALGKTSVFIRSWVGKGYEEVPNLYKGGPGRAYNVRCDRSGNELDHLEWPEEEWPRLIQELSRQNAAETKVTKTFPYQIGGWSPYLVVNNGGHKAADIKDCPALFLEFDAPISKEEARLKIKAFPLRPSIVIESRAGYHCMPLDTEILTKDGWKTWDQVHAGETVMGYDVQHRSLRWTNMEGKIFKESDELIRIGNDRFSAVCTPNHKWVVKKKIKREGVRQRGQKKEYMSAPQLVPANQIAKNSHQLVLSAPLHLPGTCSLSEDECAILGWFASDGTLFPSGEAVAKSPCGYGAKFQASIGQSLKKPDCVAKIRHLLQAIPHTEAPQSGNEDMRIWTFGTAWFRDLWFRSGLEYGWVKFVNSLGSLQRKAFLNAFWMGDGCFNGNQKVITQNPGEISDAVKLAVFYEGHRPSISGSSDKKCKTIRFAKSYISWNIQKQSLGSAPVWCPKTRTGTWVARQNGEIFITGNCYYLLEKPTTPSMWRQFQWRLIEYFESDTGIEDPSRCMRLPGFQHLKKGEDPFLIEMKTCEPTHKYTLEEFDSILPEIPTWRLRLERDSKPYSPVKLDDGTEWDIRNFAHVLQNYQENSRREWDTCQCPVHGGAGHSKDSLHINSKTGAYHCWSGCDPKDIYQEVCRLAGWIRPKSDNAQQSSIPIKATKDDPVSFLESTEWDEFQNLVSLLVQNIENQLELEFRLRKLCQQYGMPIGFGQQVKQLVSGSLSTFEPVWVEDFLAQKTEDRQWVIASHIPLGTVIDLCAAGGLGKTTLVYNWCKHVISGMAWNGYRVRKGKVLLVQDDEPETDTREKLDIARFYELPPRQCAITFKWQFADIEQLVRYIEKEGILLCVVDSLGSTNMGLDRDKPEFANNLKVLRDVANQFGCTFLVLDHTNKGGSQLGTVAVRNTVSELIYMLAPTEEEKRMYDLNRNHRILWFDKSRAGLGGTKFVLEQQPLDYSWTHQGLLENINSADSDEVSRNISMLLAADPDARYTISQIRSHLELDYSSTELLVEQMRRAGMIDSEWCIHGHDRYRVYYLKGGDRPNTQKFETTVEKTSTDWEEL